MIVSQETVLVEPTQGQYAVILCPPNYSDIDVYEYNLSDAALIEHHHMKASRLVAFIHNRFHKWKFIEDTDKDTYAKKYLEQARVHQQQAHSQASSHASLFTRSSHHIQPQNTKELVCCAIL